VRSLYFKIFSDSFLITFLSPEIATSINIHVLISISRIIITGLLLGMVLSLWPCWFHSMVTLPPWPVSTDLLLLLLLLLLLVVVVVLAAGIAWPAKWLRTGSSGIEF
jgi:hypothetical protein